MNGDFAPLPLGSDLLRRVNFQFARPPKANTTTVASSAESCLETALAAVENYVARQLFQSIDKTDFADRIDSLLDDDVYWNLHYRVSVCMNQLADRLADLADFANAAIDPPDVFFEGAGVARKTLVHEGWALERWTVKAILQFVGWLSRQPFVSPTAAPRDVERGRLGFMADTAVPASARRALLARERATLCDYAIAAARNHLPAEWVRDELLRTWIDSARLYLRFLATLPGVEIPNDVLPLADRVDHSRAQFSLTSRQGREQRFADAAASGDRVFPPLLEDGDDD